MVTLIFPAYDLLAIDYLEAARRRGEPVIAASSVFDPRMESAFGELIQLPYIYDALFQKQFLELVSSREVTQVYSTVASVYTFLETFLVKEKLSIQLIGTSPITQQVEAYRKLLLKTEEAQLFIGQCAHNPQATLTRLDIAAIFHYAGTIYGESNDDKLMAMMAIFSTAPEGDVIEIGSLMGKSVFAMNYLARHYGIGSVLSVDPLSAKAGTQHDAPEAVREGLISAWDYDILREAFLINLLPVGDRFNYLRMESEYGFEVYRTQRELTSPEFGTVTYTGKISVIHIDGNHDFLKVNMDCELWLTRLASGAWLILDDYVWAHGDGPYRVGNSVLRDHWQDIDRAFVCGKALFYQIPVSLHFTGAATIGFP